MNNELKLMRDWLLDCFEDEYDQEQILGLNSVELRESIERYYDGGFKQFIRDIGE